MDFLIEKFGNGGAGFLGSHLIDRLMAKGQEIICLEYFTGRKSNINKWIDNKKFELIRHDVNGLID